jgi:uncharacterized membrane protein
MSASKDSFVVLQLTFMFGSVLSLLLLPMINHAIHLNNLIHTTLDPKEKQLLDERLKKLQLALVYILIAILLIVWLLPIQLLSPKTKLTFPLFLTTCILLTVSLVIFVMDASQSIYIPVSPTTNLQNTLFNSL